MNVEQAAKRLDLPEKTVRKLMKEGRLKIGFIDYGEKRATFHIVPDWLEQFIANGPNFEGKEERK